MRLPLVRLATILTLCALGTLANGSEILIPAQPENKLAWQPREIGGMVFAPDRSFALYFEELVLDVPEVPGDLREIHRIRKWDFVAGTDEVVLEMPEELGVGFVSNVQIAGDGDFVVFEYYVTQKMKAYLAGLRLDQPEESFVTYRENEVSENDFRLSSDGRSVHFLKKFTEKEPAGQDQWRLFNNRHPHVFSTETGEVTRLTDRSRIQRDYSVPKFGFSPQNSWAFYTWTRSSDPATDDGSISLVRVNLDTHQMIEAGDLDLSGTQPIGPANLYSVLGDGVTLVCDHGSATRICGGDYEEYLFNRMTGEKTMFSTILANAGIEGRVTALDQVDDYLLLRARGGYALLDLESLEVTQIVDGDFNVLKTARNAFENSSK